VIFNSTNGLEKVDDFTSEEEVFNAALDLLCVQGVLYIQEKLYNKNRKLNIDPYAHLAEKNLTITATIDSRHIDRPGIIRMLRNKEVQRMWDEVATHEFSLTEVDKAMELTVTQQCGKVLVYPHRH